MQTKVYNAYRLTHKNGSVEDINALDMVQALENMDTSDTESRVIQAVLVKESVRTLVEDTPTEVMFTTVVAQGGGGSIATPAQGTVHVGDQISLQAIPARTYAFKGWKMNNEPIGADETLLYTIPQLADGLTSVVFTAEFELGNVAWKSVVSPEAASAAGCVAFPFGGVAEANGRVGIMAVAEGGYKFDHWERNGETQSTNRILNADVAPLAEDEGECNYVAVFKAVEEPSEPAEADRE